MKSQLNEQQELCTEDLTDSWKSNIHGLGKKDRILRCTQTCSVKGHCDRPIGNFKVEDLAT